ncbi:MAG: protein kinase [Planctomycetes bacterium]|nr:protein kinase [Planctomycetota bacterium]
MTPEPDPRGRDVPQPGLIAGYQIVERLGHGGMGAVYKARQVNLGGRIVALKILRRALSRNEAYIRRLQREARIVGGLDHPHIVKGIDLGESSGFHFFVMEYVEGETLRAILQSGRVFTEAETLQLGEQIASAIDYYGQRGIVHRDIKPGNIVLTADGVAKLMDLGLAKGPEDSALTRSGATIGTPQYLSPEQAKNPRGADVRSDLYSLGATLYHMSTGRPPFTGETVAAVLTAVLFGHCPTAREAKPDLSRGFSRLLEKLMHRDPAHRHQTPAELLRDLRAVRAGGDPEPPAVVRSRRRAFLIVGACVLGAATIVGGGVALRGKIDGHGASPPVVAAPDPSLVAVSKIGGVDGVPPHALAEYVAKLKEIADRFPESRGAGAAAELRRDVERVVESQARQIADLARRAASDVQAKPDDDVADAIDAFDRTREAETSKRFGESLSAFPDDLIQRLNQSLEAARSDLLRDIVRGARIDVSRQVNLIESETVFDRVTAAFAQASDLLEHYRAAMTEDECRDIRAEIDDAMEKALAHFAEKPRAAIDDAIALAEQGKGLQARAKLEAVAEKESLGTLKLVDRVEEARQEIAAAIESANAKATALWDSRISDLRRLVSARAYADADSALAALKSDVDAAGEGDEAQRVAARVADEAGDLAAIRALWSRVALSIASDVGREIDLPLGKDRNRKKIVAVEGERVRFTYSGDGRPEKSESLYALDVAEVRARAGAGSSGNRALAAFLVAEAETRKGREARDLLDAAQAAVPASEGAERIAGRIADVREQLAHGDEEKRDASRRLLAEADAAFDEGRFADARERYVAIRDTAAHRETYAADRARIDERIGRCDSKLLEAELKRRFHAGVVVVDERSSRIRLTYDWSSPDQLKDFEFNEKFWKVEDGKLVNYGEKPPDKENLFKHKVGFRFPQTFNVFSDFSVDFDYYPSPDPFFFAASCFGNCVGVLSGAKKRQANTWRGDLADYEPAFQLKTETRKEAAPEGVVEFRFDGDEKHHVRIEILRKGEQFRFRVDGLLKIDHKVLPQQSGGFEIRTWTPDTYGPFVFEGVLKKG